MDTFFCGPVLSPYFSRCHPVDAPQHIRYIRIGLARARLRCVWALNRMKGSGKAHDLPLERDPSPCPILSFCL
jgi:hypothetical protein